jgi:hypothetical protein
MTALLEQVVADVRVLSRNERTSLSEARLLVGRTGGGRTSAARGGTHKEKIRRGRDPVGALNGGARAGASKPAPWRAP